MKKKILSKTSTFVFYFSIVLFFIALNFELNPPGGWYQQFMPDLNNQPISDIFFLDSLTGWAVTNNNMPQDSGYILKTTNGGDNWTIKYKDRRDFSKIIFINQSTGFTCGGTGSGTAYLYKSTNGGGSWVSLTILGNDFYSDMSVLSEDTLWLVDNDGLIGGVFRTTNGGTSWQQQLYLGSENPDKIYMFNSRIGFISENGGTRYIRKTTNSGNNWTLIVSNDYFNEMYFTDSLTGWKCSVFGMKKTTDGGSSWVTQTLPSGGIIQISSILDFSVINSDTLWGTGGYVLYPNSQVRGLLYRTTNGGNNWSYQIPDTSINISYWYTWFVNKSNGWVYSKAPTGIHTTTGGDTNFYTGIIQTSTKLPTQFELKQNYPNPFNPRTVIPYKIKSSSYVRLIAYDIIGKETQRLVGQFQQAGEYEVDFMGKYGASGVYFYRIEVEDNESGKVFSETKRMMLLK